MALGFYPGCSLKGSSREYAESVLALAKAFGININEIKDWNCCGATAAHNLDRHLSLALPARTLALAREQQLDELVIPCAACYNRLVSTLHELRENENLRNEIHEIIGMQVDISIKLLNVIQFIDKYISPSLEERVVKPLSRKVACYYGCLLVRPGKVLGFDREEDPCSMDAIMARTGAVPLEWAFKTECCGAGLSVSGTETVARLSGKILTDAADRGAEAVIVACPMCHSNLDMRRKAINHYIARTVDIPVIYITQAIGLAIGLDKKDVGINRHFVRVEI
jgi:heterodisulfide reductase subunit B2